jgi:hypothetical protein
VDRVSFGSLLWVKVDSLQLLADLADLVLLGFAVRAGLQIEVAIPASENLMAGAPLAFGVPEPRQEAADIIIRFIFRGYP